MRDAEKDVIRGTQKDKILSRNESIKSVTKSSCKSRFYNAKVLLVEDDPF
jgi:hypothetical protein